LLLESPITTHQPSSRFYRNADNYQHPYTANVNTDKNTCGKNGAMTGPTTSSSLSKDTSTITIEPL
jgi:hypothetical protein